MKIIFLDEIDSTQDYLKKLLESQQDFQKKRIPDNYLVYTKNQTAGRGRQSNQWEFTPGSIACSFTFSPHKVFTLSSLEIAVIIKDYFYIKLNKKLTLKWPNDLFYQSKKLGGIIIQALTSSNQHRLIAGIGINHTNIKFDKSDMRIGIDLSDFDIVDFVKYIHKSRIRSTNQIRQSWLANCDHFQQEVQIEKEQGIFSGIGEYGQAIIKNEKGTHSFISGSLRYINKN